ncbi:MAG TPA: DUF1217 domain-containing protein [Rhodopila sp.]|uniref:DUF1217 domain-containing protein n=1 Tax=Rhodopila sp. TaxID=2480087 RepID=UPI002C9B488C|nr:DUF1217 domain-containing protein [Rhodopila sp.]HVY16496.1 DUF1217 domain-containing protein [Rhodopila sp.]
MNYDSSILALFSNIGSSGSGSDSSLLETLYGSGSTGVQGASGQSPVAALLSAQKNEATVIKTVEQQADVKTAMAAFTKAVGSATNLTQALNDPAVLNVLLTANGMADQIGNTALATKVLMSNLSDPSSLANVLTDTRWQMLAQTYNFSTNGLAVLKNPSTIAAITQGYAQINWEKQQDAATPGISDALTFIQQAGSITSVDQVLGNSTVRTVVTTALGVPEQIAFQSINAQEQAVGTRLDVKDFKDPSFVQSFAERFLVMNNLNSNSSSGSASIDTLAAELQSPT